MATFDKDVFEEMLKKYGSYEKFAQADECFLIYESDTNYHICRSQSDVGSILNSPYIKNPRVVWEKHKPATQESPSYSSQAQAEEDFATSMYESQYWDNPEKALKDVRAHKIVIYILTAMAFITIILVGIYEGLKATSIVTLVFGLIMAFNILIYRVNYNRYKKMMLKKSKSERASDKAASPSKRLPSIAKLTENKINPPTISDENVYIKRCLKQEFKEEVEERVWNSDPAFDSVLSPYNSQQFDTAIENGEKLISKFNDFDLLYKWIGDAYRNTLNLTKSREILYEGLKNSKRKYLLLTSLAETEWRSNSIENAIYFLSQVLHCLHLNEIDINAYLLMYYIAKGQELDQESQLFLQHVDKLRAGQIRLSPNEANQLVDISRKNKNDVFEKIIKELCNKYLR